MRSLLILLACLLSVATAGNECQLEGDPCDRIFLNPCCRGLKCVFDSRGDGICQKCLPSGYLCFGHSECCSKKCQWFFTCK
ncbi:unnamed protein product [Hymenolepis diminuta]|uniref:UPF0506 domain-containing protein n=1 Tax=Hymenolepis diminuta TaxID=6216 RepID=A0A0R3SYA9_HYMDI|nr:unnamed protein product [Hymenolepis diminuta]VUZ40922.1 unnamed protein product [Hymenolepis diminuta]